MVFQVDVKKATPKNEQYGGYGAYGYGGGYGAPSGRGGRGGFRGRGRGKSLYIFVLTAAAVWRHPFTNNFGNPDNTCISTVTFLYWCIAEIATALKVLYIMMMQLLQDSII